MWRRRKGRTKGEGVIPKKWLRTNPRPGGVHQDARRFISKKCKRQAGFLILLILSAIQMLSTPLPAAIHQQDLRTREVEAMPVFYNLYAGSNDDGIQRAKSYVTEQLALLLPEHQVFVRSIGAKIKVENATHVQHDEEGTEAGTLKLLWDHCHEKAYQKVVYIHNKGSLNPSKENNLLRKWLTRAALSEECYYMPSSCNVCSWRMSPLPHPHNPGNMWAAKCKYIRKLIDPAEFEMKMSQLYYNGTMPKRKGPLGDGESSIGTGRYAAEHWVHSHPSIIPCDLSTSNYVWGYKGLPEVDDKFRLEAAPRYDWSKFAIDGVSRAKPQNNLRFGIDHRLKEYNFLYNETPPTSWFGWTFYAPQNKKQHLRAGKHSSEECNKGYLNMYLDVANRVKQGRLHSGLQHWEKHGKREGRKPYCKEWL